MITRADYERNEFRVAAAFRREQRAFARRVDAVVARSIRGRQTFDVMAYALIWRELEAVLDEWYGRFPGDGSGRFAGLIGDQVRRSAAIPVREARRDVRRVVPTDVLRAIEREAA
jgi:hypothetical protein